MKDIVIIPTYRRPEYLQVCLDLIMKADRADEMTYYFACDYGYDRKALEVIANFPFDSGLIEMNDQGYHRKISKQSYNVLNAYMMAARDTKQYVFLIEDDIFVGIDYFNAHYKMQESNPFCSLGSKLHDTNFVLTGDLSTFRTTTTNVYHSHGVCFNKDVIMQYIEPHFCSQYFNNIATYCHTRFPNSSVNPVHTEQDGLINRIQEACGLPIVYLDYPRSYHAGVWGYHRSDLHPEFYNMGYDQKVAWIYEHCFDQAKIEKYDYYHDVNIVDLNLKAELHHAI